MAFADDLKYDSNGLLPVVAQDAESGQVLMVAWMNREAVEKTIATGRATYWSRSRRALWVKGETSGHVQKVKEIRVDCDRDTLLLLVEQVSAACHEGYRTCFFRRLGQDGETLTVVEKRIAEPN